jgi:hypothetical protein
MRQALVLILLLSCHAYSFGQGAVVFDTHVRDSSGTLIVDAPVRTWQGLGPGSSYYAQLVLESNGILQPLFPITTFRSDSPAASFYVVPPAQPIIVPGFPPGSSAPLFFRMWHSSYPTFEEARLNDPDINNHGSSVTANILLGDPSSPTYLIGLQGFQPVPEPSTLILGFLCSLALFLCCHLKKLLPSNPSSDY